MIMMNPNKGRVTTIVASIKQKKGFGQKPSHDGPEDQPREEYKEAPTTDTMAAKMAAMDSFLVASDKKDSRGMVRALTTFMEICQGYAEDDEEPREEPQDKPYSSPQYGSSHQD
jgi:hypothetical protein